MFLSLSQDFLLQIWERRTGTEVMTTCVWASAAACVCAEPRLCSSPREYCSSLCNRNARGPKPCEYSSTCSSQCREKSDVWFKVKRRLFDAASHSTSSHFKTGSESSGEETFIWIQQDLNLVGVTQTETISLSPLEMECKVKDELRGYCASLKSQCFTESFSLFVL